MHLRILRHKHTIQNYFLLMLIADECASIVANTKRSCPGPFNDGLNRMLYVQFARGAKLVEQVLAETKKSPLMLVPVILRIVVS